MFVFVAIPLLVKLAAVIGAAYLIVRPKKAGESGNAPAPGTKDEGFAINPISGLPTADPDLPKTTPVVGERWLINGVDLATIVSADGKYEGYYSATDSRLVAVVDSESHDASRTSAIVVARTAAPDLPDHWS